MPFERYLQDGPDEGLEFQMPSFMAAPMLAPGGGAEVVPFHSTWFTHPAPRPLVAPSPLGLPVYSASGFDLLSILVRVATRPNPRISLGPVDLTCSFVVVDVRRHDSPIVYCSPSFCRLTGYPEHEVLGRNCRFLQAPPGPGGATGVVRGEPRRFTSQDAVNALHKACATDNEVQTSIVNFRRDGSAFINLVSVIPVPGGVSGGKHELGDVAYQVGFQVDLTEQPNVILEKLRDGTYAQSQLPYVPSYPPEPPKKSLTLPQLTMSPVLAARLQSKSFLRALPISSSTTVSQPVPTPNSATNSPLSLLLLEYSPDFIHVVTLKGAFLYVAPAVTRVLGYAPHDLVGRSMADIAHPEDVVPLERQLKESSTLLLPPPNPSNTQQQAPPRPRPIDLLFRARTASGIYVWVECRGRLYAEPGKGRKAIILSGRARGMLGRLEWGVIKASPAGGLLGPVKDGNKGKTELEFFAQLSGRGHSAGALIHVSPGVTDVLGYAPKELLGRRIATLLLPDDEANKGLDEALAEDRVLHKAPTTTNDGQVKTTTVHGRLRTKSGDPVRVLMVFYRTRSAIDGQALSVSRAPLIAQIRLLDAATVTKRKPGIAHPSTENVFAELEVARGSSWQYELQQLRFANMRLEQEVEVLEAEVVEYQHKTRGREQTWAGADAGTGDRRARNKRKFGDRSMGPGSTAAPPSSSPASVLNTMGFADIASSGMGLGDFYSDMSSESSSATGSSVDGFGRGMDTNDTSDGGSSNYSIALDHYAAVSARGHITTSYTADDSALMPAPAVVPSRQYRHQTPAPAPAYPPTSLPMSMPAPSRPQTPAHPRRSLSRRASSSTLHASEFQPQQALYAPVPQSIPVTTTPSSLLGAMGQPMPAQPQPPLQSHTQHQPQQHQQYQHELQQPQHYQHELQQPQHYHQQPYEPPQYQHHQQQYQLYQQQHEYQQPMHQQQHEHQDEHQLQYRQSMQYPAHSHAPSPQQRQTLPAHGWGTLRVAGATRTVGR